MSTGRIAAISISSTKGTKKTNVPLARLIAEHGLAGDAHAGPWHRQVSLLASESIAKIRALELDVSAGEFAENITTEGFALGEVRVGDRLQIGEAMLEITQLGKECHSRCNIFHTVGTCVMPTEGVFARVLAGGEIQVGDSIRLLTEEPVEVSERQQT